MGKMFDNVRAFWNDLADSMTDPAKMANLKVADLEKALKQAKEQAALVVGRPVGLRSEIAKLEKAEKDYTSKIQKLAAAVQGGNEEARGLAAKHATKLGEIRTTLETKRGELAQAEETSKQWADRIDMLESALRQKRQQAQDIGARSAMAKAETKLGKTMDSIGGLAEDSTFDALEAKVRAEEQKAAGYSQMSGLSDAVREKQILADAEANDILKEFGI